MISCLYKNWNRYHDLGVGVNSGCFYPGGVSVHGIIYDLYYVIMITSMDEHEH